MNALPDGPAVVIVAYKPKPGKEAELLQLTREHVPILRAEGLATKRPVVACLAADGTVVEVFEWAAGGIERAHSKCCGAGAVGAVCGGLRDCAVELAG